MPTASAATLANRISVVRPRYKTGRTMAGKSANVRQRTRQRRGSDLRCALTGNPATLPLCRTALLVGQSSPNIERVIHLDLGNARREKTHYRSGGPIAAFPLAVVGICGHNHQYGCGDETAADHSVSHIHARSPAAAMPNQPAGHLATRPTTALARGPSPDMSIGVSLLFEAGKRLNAAALRVLTGQPRCRAAIPFGRMGQSKPPR